MWAPRTFPMVSGMPMVAYISLDKSGEAHAVPSWNEDTALCGRTVLSFAGRPWPLVESLWPESEPRCPDCTRAVYGAKEIQSPRSGTPQPKGVATAGVVLSRSDAGDRRWGRS